MSNGNIAIRVKPGSENFVTFVPTQSIESGFGQTPRYWRNGVGKGNSTLDIPAQHLEYYDYETDKWVSADDIGLPPMTDWIKKTTGG